MSKINKLGKSTFVIAILSFLLVAVLGFGGTYAYFSANSDAYGNTFTTGHVTMTAPTEVTSVTADSLVVPGQPIIDKALSVGTKANVDSVLFAVVAATVTGTGTDISIGNTAEDEIKLAVDAGWTPLTTTTTGTTVYVYGTTNGVFKDAAITTDNAKPFTANPIYLDKEVKGEKNMDVEVTLTITFYITQADYLGTKNGDNALATDKSAKNAYNAAKTYVFSEAGLPELAA